MATSWRTPGTVVEQEMASIRLDPAPSMDGVQSTGNKYRLRTETGNALSRGVFGSPFNIINDQPFWGGARYSHIQRLFG